MEYDGICFIPLIVPVNLSTCLKQSTSLRFSQPLVAKSLLWSKNYPSHQQCYSQTELIRALLEDLPVSLMAFWILSGIYFDDFPSQKPSTLGMSLCCVAGHWRVSVLRKSGHRHTQLANPSISTIWVYCREKGICQYIIAWHRKMLSENSMDHFWIPTHLTHLMMI